MVFSVWLRLDGGGRRDGGTCRNKDPRLPGALAICLGDSHQTDAAESSTLPNEMKSTQLQKALCHPGWALGQPGPAACCRGQGQHRQPFSLFRLVSPPQSLTLLLRVQTRSCSPLARAVRVPEPRLLHLSFEAGECMSVGVHVTGGHRITWVAVLRDCPTFVFEVESLTGLELH